MVLGASRLELSSFIKRTKPLWTYYIIWYDMTVGFALFYANLCGSIMWYYPWLHYIILYVVILCCFIPPHMLWYYNLCYIIFMVVYYNIVLCCIILHYIRLCHTILCSTISCYAIAHDIILDLLHYTMLDCIVLYSCSTTRKMSSDLSISLFQVSRYIYIYIYI